MAIRAQNWTVNTGTLDGWMDEWLNKKGLENEEERLMDVSVIVALVWKWITVDVLLIMVLVSVCVCVCLDITDNETKNNANDVDGKWP